MLFILRFILNLLQLKSLECCTKFNSGFSNPGQLKMYHNSSIHITTEKPGWGVEIVESMKLACPF